MRFAVEELLIMPCANEPYTPLRLNRCKNNSCPESSGTEMVILQPIITVFCHGKSDVHGGHPKPFWKEDSIHWG